MRNRWCGCCRARISSSAVSLLRGSNRAATIRRLLSSADARLRADDEFPCVQSARRKNCAKDWRTFAWFETLDINSAWKIEKFSFRHPALAKSLGRSFRKHQQQRGKVVFFDGTFRPQDKLVFPAPNWSPLSGSLRFGPRGNALGKIAVPGRNLYDRRNSFPLRDAQGLQAIARPAVKQIILARPELRAMRSSRGIFLRAIIIRSVERRKRAAPDASARIGFSTPEFRFADCRRRSPCPEIRPDTMRATFQKHRCRVPSRRCGRKWNKANFSVSVVLGAQCAVGAVGFRVSPDIGTIIVLTACK